MTESTDINSENWASMTLTALYTQKNIIINRMNYSYKTRIIYNSLQQGLDKLEYHISNKLNDSNSSNNNIIL